MAKWRKNVLLMNAGLYSILMVLFIWLTISLDYWEGFRFAPPWLEDISGIGWLAAIVVVLGIAFAYMHFMIRKFSAKRVLRLIRSQHSIDDAEKLENAFKKNTRPWRSIFAKEPAGWTRRSRKTLHEVVKEADSYVQLLNDQFTNPSGQAKKEE